MKPDKESVKGLLKAEKLFKFVEFPEGLESCDAAVVSLRSWALLDLRFVPEATRQTVWILPNNLPELSKSFSGISSGNT